MKRTSLYLRACGRHYTGKNYKAKGDLDSGKGVRAKTSFDGVCCYLRAIIYRLQILIPARRNKSRLRMLVRGKPDDGLPTTWKTGCA